MSGLPARPAILTPHAEVAERVLLPGDPRRALLLAQRLMDGPRMLNHARGLWGYSGSAADGALLTIQSTGFGGPSLAAVVRDLAGLGARRLVRIGTARGNGAAPGSLVIAREALALDGTSRALGAGEAPLRPDPALLAALRAAAPGAPVGAVASTDLLDAPAPGALAVDLSTAPLLALASRLGLAAASVLLLVGDEGATEDGEARLGDLGFAALRPAR